MSGIAQALKKGVVIVALLFLFFTAFTVEQVGTVMQMLGDGLGNVVTAVTEAVDQ